MSADTTFTYDQVQALLIEALRASRAPSPLEEKQLKEMQLREQRAQRRGIEEGYNDELRRWNQQNGCTHCRWPMFAGAKAGQMAPRGQGEWMTSGQVCGDEGMILLLCVRCKTEWKFKGTRQELDYVVNSEHGLLGFEPPPIERCVNKDEFLKKPPLKPEFQQCGRCRETFLGRELAAHACTAA